MRARATLAALALAALAAGAAGCGEEGEDLIEEGELRQCLSEAGLALEPPELGANAGLGSVSPDFRARTAEGALVAFVVEGTERKAERAAADVAAARAGFGGGGEVVANANAIAVFEDDPAAGAREAVEGCLRP